MIQNGFIDTVGLVRAGTSLKEDALTGTTVLSVDDAIDFFESGGSVEINGHVYTYTAADLDSESNTVTLSTGVIEDLFLGQPVYVSPEAVEKRASVTLSDTGDTLDVKVSHSLYDRIPEGIRDEGTREVVTLDIVGGEWAILDVVGKQPVIDGAYIDPETVPPTSTDGLVPASSPTPELITGYEILIARWTPIVNHDPVTYEVHISDTTGFTPDADTLVGETINGQFTIRALPGDPPALPGDPDLRQMQYDTDYFVRIVAKDKDGAATPGTEVAGQIHQIGAGSIAAQTITGEEIVAGSFTGEEFAGEVFVGGVFKTGATGQRVEFGVEGIQGFRSDNSRRFNVPTTDEEDIFLDGQIVARGLQVKDGASFEGTQNEITKDGALVLSTGITSPSGSPQVSMDYEKYRFDSVSKTAALGTFALVAGEVTSILHNPSGLTNVYHKRAGGTRVWRFTAAGVYDSHTDFVDWDIVGETFLPSDPTNGYLLFRYIPAGQQYYVAHNGLFNTYSRLNGTRIPFIGNNGSAIFVGEILSTQRVFIGFRSAGLNATNYGAFPAATSSITTNISQLYNAVNPQVLYGNFDGGGNRYVISEVGGTGLIRMFNASGTWLPDDNFESPATKRGFKWDGSNFYTYGVDGYMYKHTTFTWTAATSSVLWTKLSLRDDNATGGTHETTPGPVQQITLNRRSRLKVSLPPLPYAGGVDDPNKWVVYTGRGASQPANSGMWEQATANVSTPIVYVASLATSSTNPPTVNNFPGATPGELRNPDLSLVISGSGAAKVKSLEVTNAAVLNGGLTVTGAVTARGTVFVTTYSGTTDASGFLTVTHGAGFTPAGGWAVTSNPSTSFAGFWGMDTIGATTLRMRFFHTGGTGNLVSANVSGRLFLVRP